MYVPEWSRESRLEVLHDVIRQHSFGALVSVTDSGLTATHVPFLIAAERGPRGTLIAHMARANPQWRSLSAAGEVLVIFQGPHAYVSPNWYVDGDRLPTWNYVAVHAYGTPRVVEDPAELLAILQRLVGTLEERQDDPWQLPWPDAFVERRMKAVVAFEIELTRVEGRFKLTQNRSAADREGAIAGLSRQADPQSRAVATTMRSRDAEEPR